MIDIDKGFDRLVENDLLYEDVLYIVAEASWKRRLAKGILNKADLLKIQKSKGMPDPLYVKQLLKQGKDKAANTYLKKKGLIKPARQWLAAVEKGTQNILKKYKAKEKHTMQWAYGMMQGKRPGTKVQGILGSHAKLAAKKPSIHVVSPEKITKKTKGLATIVKRHEADEVRTAKRLIKKTGVRKSAIGIHAQTTGGHAGREVLRKERDLVRTAKALYGKGGGGKELNNVRKTTKEYEHLLNSKKKVGKSDVAGIKAANQAITDARKVLVKSIKDFLKGKTLIKAIKKKKLLNAKMKKFKARVYSQHLRYHRGDVKKAKPAAEKAIKQQWKKEKIFHKIQMID